MDRKRDQRKKAETARFRITVLVEPEDESQRDLGHKLKMEAGQELHADCPEQGILEERYSLRHESRKAWELEREIARFCGKPKTRRELAERFGFQSSSYLMQKYILPMVRDGILQMTLPDRPKSKNQRFFTVVDCQSAYPSQMNPN